MSSSTIEKSIPVHTTKRLVGPVFALLLLAPIVGEVLSGATRVSYIFALLPEVMVWGCGALIIRELVVRWGGGLRTILLLGLALAIAEEFLIQQTSLAPIPFAPGLNYGRVWGVNWVYFLFMLAYESIWIVLVPIHLTHLIFPERRNQPWLKTRGLVISAVVFLVGSHIAWFLWTQQARRVVFSMPDYKPPLITMLLGALAIVVLVLLAFAVRGKSKTQPPVQKKALSPLTVGLLAFFLGLPWYLLITLVFVPYPPVSSPIALAAGCVWAIACFLLFERWSSAAGWNDIHRWAACFGTVWVCILGGFLGSNYWPRIDLIGKIVLNVAAILLLLRLGGSVKRAALGANPSSQQVG
jgi:hypothetical protein